MSPSSASSHIALLVENVSPVAEEVRSSGYDDLERAYKDPSGRAGSFPNFSKFAKEWENVCKTFTGRFKSYLVVGGVVAGANYGISRVTGVMENPLTKLLSMTPAVFIFYSLLASCFFSYVISFVQDPVCGLGMIFSASEKGQNGRETFINMWKKVERLPTTYMQLSLVASVAVHALTVKEDLHLHPRAFEAGDLVVWGAFVLGSIPLISAFNAVQREVARALESNNPNYAKLRKA